MVDLNRVVLVGRLTRDAELKSIASGQAVCKFSIAVNRRRKNGDHWEDEANFFDIVLWGRSGEVLHQYLIKGKMVGIDGELKQDRWVQDGQNRSRVEIVANNVQLLGGNPGSQGSGGSGYSDQSYSQQRNRGQAQGSDSGWQPSDDPGRYEGNSDRGSNEDSFADDIPF